MLSDPNLIDAILERRGAIRRHRDQKGDDRCWVDDWFVWSLLDDSPTKPISPPQFDEAMNRCREFWTHRQSMTADPSTVETIIDRLKWDSDISGMNTIELNNTLAKLNDVIRLHRDINSRPRTLDDDRNLYAALPEKVPADFRLPPENEFLGEAKTPKAGCPSFWRSHSQCRTSCHDLHSWGPCQEK